MSSDPKPTTRSGLPPWLIYAICAATCWGIWGVLSKGPSRELSSWMTQVLFTPALIPSALIAFFSPRFSEGTDKPRGIIWGFISGLIAAAGNICFFMALESGADTAVAIPLTNIYPLVTIIIAFFIFKERLNWIQGGGILIGFAAIILLSGEARHFGDPLELLARISASKWMLFSFGAMVCWGVFSATQKISTNHVSAELSYVAWCAAFVPIAVVIMVSVDLDWNMSQPMLWSALVAGAVNGFGVIFAFAAYRYEGKAAIVTPLAAAVQPMVTIALALLFLGERLGMLESIGIVLAILAAIALSRESKAEPTNVATDFEAPSPE